jgi:hypothetical protein
MAAFEQAESVRRETSNVKRFGGRALGSPTFHLITSYIFTVFESDFFSILPVGIDAELKGELTSPDYS